MQGQAQSEDGENDIPTVIYQDEEVPLTSISEPTGQTLHHHLLTLYFFEIIDIIR
jgi:hypothetical protein